MTDPLDVKAHEHGITRVFVADADPDAPQTPLTAEKAAELLGGKDIDARKIEVVASGALEGMGLSGYLVDGYGIPAEDVAPDRPELDSLTGQVVLIPSSAFSGAQRLSPEPALRLVGAYSESPSEAHEVMSPAETPKRDAAQTSAEPHEGEKKRRVPVGVIVAVSLALAVILVLLF